MSTPDARLSAAERAALADLETAAAAADPGLAALLGGGTGRRIRSDVRLLRMWVLKVSRAVTGARWWGIPITVAGMALMVLGLGPALPLSFAGALVTAVGLGVIAHMVQAHLARLATERKGRAG